MYLVHSPTIFQNKEEKKVSEKEGTFTNDIITYQFSSLLTTYFINE